MDAKATIEQLRYIRRNCLSSPERVAAALEGLEHEIAGTAAEDFDDCPVEGFDTILSYLRREHPTAFDLIDEPVHGTISDGILVAKKARNRGIPVLRVTPPAHMQRRFPKAKTVNAYPTEFLAEVYGDAPTIIATFIYN